MPVPFSLALRFREAPVGELFNNGIQVEGDTDARLVALVQADLMREPSWKQHASAGLRREGDALSCVMKFRNGVA